MAAPEQRASSREQTDIHAGRRRCVLLIWLVLSTGLIAATATELTLQRQNTLHRNGRWTSTRTELGRSLVGAVHFMTTTTALHANRLNLGAWNGYQEVLFHEPVQLSCLQFRCQIPVDSYLITIYERSNAGTRAFRLSRHADFPSESFVSDLDGCVVSRQPIPVELSGGWQTCKLRIDTGRGNLSVNGRTVAALEAPGGKCRFGFRGGLRNVFLDDVLVRTLDRGEIRESFENRQNYLPTLLLATIVSGLLIAAALGWPSARSAAVSSPAAAAAPAAGWSSSTLRRWLLIQNVLAAALLILLATRRSSSPDYMGFWSQRMFSLVCAGGLAFAGLCLLTRQAWRVDRFQESIAGKLLGQLRGDWRLLIAAGVIPPILAGAAIFLLLKFLVPDVRMLLAAAVSGTMLVIYEAMLWGSPPASPAAPSGEGQPAIAALPRACLLSTSLLAATGLLYGFDFWILSARHTQRRDATADDYRFHYPVFIEFEDAVVPRLEREVTVPKPGGTVRILFVGTSQTWGAGAEKRDETMVTFAEQTLNLQVSGNCRIECINAGIPGHESPRLLELYRSHWLRFEPDLVVVNLGNNDRNSTVLQASLKELAELNSARRIPTVFLLEPCSSELPAAESRQLLENHAAMSLLGQRLSVPVIDVPACLVKERDAGHLWWDRVHLTSFGQRFFADCLCRELTSRRLIPGCATPNG